MDPPAGEEYWFDIRTTGLSMPTAL